MEIELPLADCPQDHDIYANAYNAAEWQNKELKRLGIYKNGHSALKASGLLGAMINNNHYTNAKVINFVKRTAYISDFFAAVER